MKTALITGVTGQDGSYLAELLLKKGYQVYGVIRRSSDFTTKRIDHIFTHPRFYTFHGDLTDSANIYRILEKTQPDEIYNLGAQSHVGLSFEIPEYSSNVDALGVLRLLSVVHDMKLPARLYQASTSELFGGTYTGICQNEHTPFHPRSPYATAKLYAHWATCNFREAYNMFAVNGILFNHESPRRGRTFVTKKITQAVAKIARNQKGVIKLGNLEAKRDWGYAAEYVECMWRMLQKEEPQDYVVGTGVSHSVREFVEHAFKIVDIDIEWQGNGVNEIGVCKKSQQLLVQVDPFYYRPLEVDCLCADATKAKTQLGWQPKVDFYALVKMMVEYDLRYDEYGHPDRVEEPVVMHL